MPKEIKFWRKRMKYKAKLYTYYTYTRQDHTAEGVTLQHFAQTTLWSYVALVKHALNPLVCLWKLLLREVLLHLLLLGTLRHSRCL